MADTPSLLVLLLDTNSAVWGKHLSEENSNLQFANVLNPVLSFLNAFSFSNPDNDLAVIAFNSFQTAVVYPPPQKPGTETRTHSQSDIPVIIGQRLQEFVLETSKDSQAKRSAETSLLAAGLTRALCFVRAMAVRPGHPPQDARIMVIAAGRDYEPHHNAAMNCIFAAQKKNIPIDGLMVETYDSPQLQQACDLTAGYYYRAPSADGLLQILLTLYLPSPAVRPALTLPPSPPVDYRSSCFCHGKAVNIAYVCSVCLSLFCEPVPVCLICGAKFPLRMGGPNPQSVEKKEEA